MGIKDPVDLYELHAEGTDPQWLRLRDDYEQALLLFESGEWTAASQLLDRMMEERRGREDTPTKLLRQRVAACVESPPETFDPIVRLDVK